MHALLENAVLHTETDHKGSRHYALGTMSASNGVHDIALAIVGVGNNISAVATTQLLNDLPSVRTVILSGISGGVPNVAKPEDHVRLGDIVACGEHGVVQYDFIKEEAERVVPRHPPRPPNSNLIRAARAMEAHALSGARPWDELVDRVLSSLKWKRPAESTDLLAATDDPSLTLRHPKDVHRIRGRSRVFIGPIASASTLLKLPERRDRLRDQFGVRAVEMEGSGTADAAWMAQAQHFVVRGVCDYCDSRKGDDWQNYAAAAAAGYVAAILRTIGPVEVANGPMWRRNSIRPDAARSRSSRLDTPESGDETQRRIDETQTQLRAMLVSSGREISLLLPMISWVTSLDRKFQKDRLLAREAQALAVIHEEMRRTAAQAQRLDTRMSPVERLSMNLLERYQTSTVLRTNWEVRCAIGNLLTFAVSAGSQGSRSSLVSEMMRLSDFKGNWDLAQMLFDAIHHAGPLTRNGREFLMTTAIEHEHAQVRWNVAAALKSIQLTDGDLRRTLAMLLRDPSPWVVKEVVDLGFRNHRVMAELDRPRASALVLERLELDEKLMEHMMVRLGSRHSAASLPRFANRVPRTPREFESSNLCWLALAEDFRRVDELKARQLGDHGKQYQAAERVVLDRVAIPDPERQQSAIIGYLHASHDALAWASVRALFSGHLVTCEDGVFHRALSEMLTHSSDWIRRECVEEILRLEDGRRKYVALRQVEQNKDALATVDEIRPYLVEIGMQLSR